MAYCTTTVSPAFYSRRHSANLKLVGKCFTPERPNPDGVTLLFFHCAGSHKECFEPTIIYLLGLHDPAHGALYVREAWTFDMQSHGEAAALNAQVLKTAQLSVEDWGEGIKAFLVSGALDGHKIVPVGHSLGATALLLAVTPGGLPIAKFKFLILIEPSLISQASWDEHAEDRKKALLMMSKAVSKRRDTWASREEAQAYFEERVPWGIWDSRILELYVKHGLLNVEVDENGTAATKVALACTKPQENAAYTLIDAHFVVLDTVKNLSLSTPIHWILGARVDLVPEYCHSSVISMRPIASLQRVPDGGHFVVQENPDGVGFAIGQILSGAVSRPRASL